MTGECRRCGRRLKLTRQGTLYMHKNVWHVQYVCPGSGLPPAVKGA